MTLRAASRRRNRMYKPENDPLRSSPRGKDGHLRGNRWINALSTPCGGRGRAMVPRNTTAPDRRAGERPPGDSSRRVRIRDADGGFAPRARGARGRAMPNPADSFPRSHPSSPDPRTADEHGTIHSAPGLPSMELSPGRGLIPSPVDHFRVPLREARLCRDVARYVSTGRAETECPIHQTDSVSLPRYLTNPPSFIGSTGPGSHRFGRRPRRGRDPRGRPQSIPSRTRPSP